ncbi:MAG TPA: DUF3489 domain-containing protein [Devosia sp.]|jgi:hypothetical protein|uniref:DUF3489 domain-containing protein n=1 Tax=Devosia sp. TaxID=1871048 RepID=UPI002DDD38E2|nr:DUF3489 domain-containing protein [Devosia sp.]HEV2517148.1 DUF3489 domain-containing protein [Devosia sp.]
MGLSTKQKVDALLGKTVANGCTAGEQSAAVAKAREMVAKYKLRDSDFVWPLEPTSKLNNASEKPKRNRQPVNLNPKEGTKSHRVFAAMRRAGGATTAELLELTGWVPHTLRGFVSHANKDGARIVTGRGDGVTRYAM